MYAQYSACNGMSAERRSTPFSDTVNNGDVRNLLLKICNCLCLQS